ncbi:hypothetical protein ASALC70_00834 [Alcanivorax sp. ALC70]|mgnify:CR=1 FL=1|nr:hypothetical protein ASALC70_00834 [Alcanivorax sp. ALC70]
MDGFTAFPEGGPHREASPLEGPAPTINPRECARDDPDDAARH